MNEIQFLHKNSKKWKEFEAYLDKKTPANPDKVSEMFIHLTDDLAYARSYFPDSKAAQYLNQLTQKTHQIIYQNPPKKKNRITAFWLSEFPLLVYSSRKEILAKLSSSLTFSMTDSEIFSLIGFRVSFNSVRLTPSFP